MREMWQKLGMLQWLWVSVVVLLLDQLTKQIALNNLEWYRMTPVMSNLNWYLTENPGAAFSFLSDAGGWQRWFFTAIALIVSGILIAWLRSLKPQERWNAISLTMILGGAVGNVVDRILYGHVIDFIQYYYQSVDSCLWGFSHHTLAGQGTCIWPAFNIADSAISVGAVMLIIELVRDMLRHRKSAAQAQTGNE